MKQDARWKPALKWLVGDFAELRLGELQDKGWDKLKRDLHKALYPGQKRSADYDESFSHSAVAEAQSNVRNVLSEIATKNRHPEHQKQKRVELKLRGMQLQDLRTVVAIEPDGRIWNAYYSKDLRTVIYLTLIDAIRYSGAASQIRSCDNRFCGKFFFSKRKPRDDRNGHYCSYPCCHRESTRRYRESQKTNPSTDANFKAVERERVSAYYSPTKKRKNAA